MTQIAKLFLNGRSQAVRLPSAYRFNCKEVYIRKDPGTGDVIISRKPGEWEDFFKLLDNLEIPEDFMSDREDTPLPERELF